jgi:predicted porin
MKYKMLGVLICMGITKIADAQSSVTLYGVIGEEFAYNNNAGGHQQYAETSGSKESSRWGLMGTEDLGGGLSAVFDLENGFNASTGAITYAGDMFGKAAWVGLSSTKFGTLTIGRQYDSVLDYISQFTTSDNWAGGYGSHPGDMDNMNNNWSENNAVKFKSADYSGLTFGGTYAFGNKAGNFTQNQIITAGAGYQNGPFVMGVAYVNARDPNYSYFGTLPDSSATGSNMEDFLVYSGYASAHTLQVIAVGASYTLGPSTFGGTYSNTQFQNLGYEAGLGGTSEKGDSANFHNVEVNYKFQATAAWQLSAAYVYTKGYGVNEATYQIGQLGTDYSLSKRTDIYLIGLYEHAAGADSTGAAARAQLTFQAASSTANQLVILTGIRHSF